MRTQSGISLESLHNFVVHIFHIYGAETHSIIPRNFLDDLQKFSKRRTHVLSIFSKVDTGYYDLFVTLCHHFDKFIFEYFERFTSDLTATGQPDSTVGTGVVTPVFNLYVRTGSVFKTPLYFLVNGPAGFRYNNLLFSVQGVNMIHYVFFLIDSQNHVHRKIPCLIRRKLGKTTGEDDFCVPVPVSDALYQSLHFLLNFLGNGTRVHYIVRNIPVG